MRRNPGGWQLIHVDVVDGRKEGRGKTRVRSELDSFLSSSTFSPSPTQNQPTFSTNSLFQDHFDRAFALRNLAPTAWGTENLDSYQTTSLFVNEIGNEFPLSSNLQCGEGNLESFTAGRSFPVPRICHSNVAQSLMDLSDGHS